MASFTPPTLLSCKAGSSSTQKTKTCTVTGEYGVSQLQSAAAADADKACISCAVDAASTSCCASCARILLLG
jgi:hypothetical protein